LYREAAIRQSIETIVSSIAVLFLKHTHSEAPKILSMVSKTMIFSIAVLRKPSIITVSRPFPNRQTAI